MARAAATRVLSGLDAWRRFTAVYAHLMAHLARELARATGLSEADYQVLDALLDAPGGRARALQLRVALEWEKSRLSHQLARMVERGLLARTSCVEDARGADIALTDAGREAGQRARRVRAESVRTMVLETLGAEGMACLDEVATVLATRLSEAAQADPACRAALVEATGRDDDRALADFIEAGQQHR